MSPQTVSTLEIVWTAITGVSAVLAAVHLYFAAADIRVVDETSLPRLDKILTRLKLRSNRRAAAIFLVVQLSLLLAGVASMFRLEPPPGPQLGLKNATIALLMLPTILMGLGSALSLRDRRQIENLTNGKNENGPR